MDAIPKKVSERLAAGIKQYRPILESAKARDVGEADTVYIIKNMLHEVFGYDKFLEVTSEFEIRGTYCDLAVKIDDNVRTLIEAKAVNIALKESHVKQVVDYAANKGVDWVLLTNGICWRVYHVTFSKPIDHELVVDLDFLALNPRAVADLEMLYLWCKEGMQRSVLGEYQARKQALSRFLVGAVLLTEPVLDVIRRELRRLSPDTHIDIGELDAVLTNEVIKRDVLDGDKADEARKRVAKSVGKPLRVTAAKVDAKVLQSATNNPKQAPTSE